MIHICLPVQVPAFLSEERREIADAPQMLTQAVWKDSLAHARGRHPSTCCAPMSAHKGGCVDDGLALGQPNAQGQPLQRLCQHLWGGSSSFSARLRHTVPLKLCVQQALTGAGSASASACSLSPSPAHSPGKSGQSAWAPAWPCTAARGQGHTCCRTRSGASLPCLQDAWMADASLEATCSC